METAQRKSRLAEVSIEYDATTQPDYWQGVGTSFTRWDDVYAGSGSTMREAMEDALENLACGTSLSDADNAMLNEAEKDFLETYADQIDVANEGEDALDYVAVYVRWNED